METFGQALRRRRLAAGFSQPLLARHVHVDQSAVSRWENDRTGPDPPTAARLDDVLGSGGELARLGHVADPVPLPPPHEPVTGDYIDELRAAIAHLVELDGRYGGAELVPMAGRMLRAASNRFGTCPASLRTDFAATVAELGEVAGWLAFDATRFDQARAFNLGALHHARLAGDSNMELFVLGNMAMQARETGRPHEALGTAGLMERFQLSPRLRVMATLRRARAAADLGDERSFRLIRAARAEVDSSIQPGDPSWTWWVDRRELQVHEAGMWRAIGRSDRAIDLYAEALDAAPSQYRWAAFIGGAGLVTAMVDARSWRETELAAEQLAALAPQVSSGRATRRLRVAATTAREHRAPTSVEDLLTALASH